VSYLIERIWKISSIKSDDGSTFPMWALCGIIGAILIGTIPFAISQYRFSLVYFVAQDENLKVQSAMDTIRESKRILKGYKWKLFKIELLYSIIVFIVLLLGLGISASLFFIPHGVIFLVVGIILTLIAIAIIGYITNGRRQVVKALFYIDLAKEKGNEMIKSKKTK
jgi:uncharacterized membrane protein